MKKRLLFIIIFSFAAPASYAGQERDPQRREEAEDYFDRWLREDVLYVITAEERVVFQQLTTAEEKERFIEQFWNRRDPDPRTPTNEFREEHYRRLAYANERFTSGVPGWKTDRGRIYIIHGPPVEIQSYKSGAAYDRPTHEGGGFTRTVPFEIWRYRNIEGIGPDVEIEFVDPSGSGEFRLARTPWEKDAFLLVPGTALTVAEEFGLADRVNHPHFSPGTADRYPGMNQRYQDSPFIRYERYVQVQRAPEIQYKDLKELVDIDITYENLPFEAAQAHFHINPQRVLVPVTVEIENRNLSFDAEDGNHVARVAVYGLVTSLSNQVVAEFDDDLMVSYQPRFLSEGLQGRSVYQKTLALEARMRYRLDLVVKDLKSGHVGIKRIGLIPPAYSPELATSSVVMADLLQRVEDVQQEEMFVLGDVKVRPRLNRQFPVDSPVWVYLHLYNIALDQSTLTPSVKVTYVLTQGDELIRRDVEEGGESLDFYAGGHVALARRLPIENLPAGRYRLEIEIEDQVQEKTVSTETEFDLTDLALQARR
jgi:GWxTD domain-containing protein